eukprot:augustus_masked-scaffold_8-processed-gene-10.4-mRNA-1 protein AED:0.06 eAED:0.06 QI:0/-1/0/1/-1/1/1/0/220
MIVNIRKFSRLFNTATSQANKPTYAFLQSLGYTPKLSSAIISSLLSPETGITQTSLLAFTKSLAGAHEIGEDNGLVPLAKSIEQELSRKEGKSLISFNITLPNSQETYSVKGFEDMTLKDIAEYGTEEGADFLSEYLECACSGIMACSTCQIYVDEEWFDKVEEVNPLTEEELDMLDLAFEPRETSRLGCQIKLKKEIDGFKFSLPGSSNNLFDHIPFKD